MGFFKTWGDKEWLTRFDCAPNGGNGLVSDLTIHIHIVWKIGMLPGIVQILVFLLRIIVLILFQSKESSFRRIMRFCKAHFNGGAMMNLTEGAGIETLFGKEIGNGGMFLDEGGDELVTSWFNDLPGGTWGALLLVLGVIFLLGFMLDFIEITFVVIPIVGPILLGMGIDPVWLGVLIAVNLQTSFLTPPFGFALFYLRGVAPPELPTTAIYRGVVPFIVLQLLLLGLLLAWPGLATWLPELLYG